MLSSGLERKEMGMGIMSFFSSIFPISFFESRPPSSGASPEGILGVPCIERLNSIYLDCYCAETGLQEVEVIRYQKANNKRRLSFIRDIILGRRNTTLFWLLLDDGVGVSDAEETELVFGEFYLYMIAIEADIVVWCPPEKRRFNIQRKSKR